MIESPSESTFDGLPQGQWRYVGPPCEGEPDDLALYDIVNCEVEERAANGLPLPMKTRVEAVSRVAAWEGDLVEFYDQFKRI